MPYRSHQKRTRLDPVMLWRLMNGGYRIYKESLFQVGRVTANAANREAMRAIEEGRVSGKQQAMKMLTLEDYERLGMTAEHSGPYLGYCDGEPIFNCFDIHEAWMGPVGTGKTTTSSAVKIAQTGLGPNPESMIGFDVKEDAELFRLTYDGRKKIDGRAPVLVNPLHMHGAPNFRVNFTDKIKRLAENGLPYVDDVIALTATAHGDVSMRGANSWIGEAARKAVRTRMVWSAEKDPDGLNPGALHDFGCLTQYEFHKLMVEIAHSDAGDGYAAMMAKKLLSTYGVWEGSREGQNTAQFEWMSEAIQEAWKLYAPGSVLRKATEASDVDFRLFKQRPQAAYVMMPDKYVDEESHGPYIASLLDYILETIADAPGNVRTNIIAEEFAQYPRVRSMVKALRLYRSKNIRVLTYVQDRGGYDSYGKGSGYRPFEENSITMAWGISDTRHLKDIELWAGYRAELIGTQNASVGVAADGAARGGQEVLVPNLPASMAAAIGKGQAIIHIPGEGVGILDRPPYWELPWIRDFINNPRELKGDHHDERTN